MASSNNSDNPCAEFGPVQKAATAWFAFVIIGGACLVCLLAGIDRHMWETNGEFLDYTQYRDNRDSFTAIGSERIDDRQRGVYSTANSRALGK